MRDIKFRVWHIKEKEMYEPGSDGNFWADGVCRFRTNSFGSIAQVEVVTWTAIGGPDPDPMLTTLYDFEIELMQYTGLKDKNGKEVYEGDLVKGAETNYKEIGEVRWYQHWSGFGIDWQYLSNQPLTDITRELEVIGNIYENPELLYK